MAATVLAPVAYRVGTLATNGMRSAIPPATALSQPAAMLDPFSLGTVRKGSADPHRRQENRAVARFPKPSAGLEPATPSLPLKSGNVPGRGAESQSPCLYAG